MKEEIKTPIIAFTPITILIISMIIFDLKKSWCIIGFIFSAIWGILA